MTSQPFRDEIDYAAHPELYRYTPNELGVFHVHPYKDELLPLWAFRTPEIAARSIEALQEKFRAYRDARDFVGMDMVRKYLRMGYTRSMRYAKYPGGRKKNPDGTPIEPQQWADSTKRESALLYKEAWDALRTDPDYEAAKAAFIATYHPS